jgi:hypothetical protein
MSDTAGIPHPLDIYEASPREAWVVAADGDALARCNGNAAWLMTATDVARQVRDALALVEIAKDESPFDVVSERRPVGMGWAEVSIGRCWAEDSEPEARKRLAARLVATALKLLEGR